jgi:hypothetical protein
VCACVFVGVGGITVAQDSYQRPAIITMAQDSYQRPAISVTNVDFNETRRCFLHLVPFRVPLLQTSVLHYP